MPANPALGAVLATAIAVTTVALAACGATAANTGPTAHPTTTASAAPTTPAPVQAQLLAVSTMDDMFMGPAALAPGLTTIRLHNGGPAPHQLQLLRLNDGVSAERALAAAKTGNPGALLSITTVAGGPNAVAAGQEQQVTVDLVAGTYLEVCFVPDPDGVRHVAKGMVAVLTVAGTRTSVPSPVAVATVKLADFTFSLPSPFDGHGRLQVINDGSQPHELTILALARGKTVDDATTFLTQAHPSGPPPFAEAGGLGAIAPGQSAWLDLDLPAGRYAAVCFVPDPTTSKPHVMLGMAAGFTVT